MRYNHEESIMKENRGSILVQLLILVVVGFGVYYIIQTIHDAAQQAVAPWQQANNAMQTQVSDLLHPTPTVIPDPITYINQIQALARLETIRYSAEQVVEANNPNPLPALPFLFQNKLYCEVHGVAIAGIDMSKLHPGDMQLQNGALYVKLPPSEVFDVSLDEGNTQILDAQNGILTKPDLTLVPQCLQGAKDKILKAAIDDGILDQAEKNAQIYLAGFFSTLGYPKAVFQVTPSE